MAVSSAVAQMTLAESSVRPDLVTVKGLVMVMVKGVDQRLQEREDPAGAGGEVQVVDPPVAGPQLPDDVAQLLLLDLPEELAVGPGTVLMLVVGDGGPLTGELLAIAHSTPHPADRFQCRKMPLASSNPRACRNARASMSS